MKKKALDSFKCYAEYAIGNESYGYYYWHLNNKRFEAAIMSNFYPPRLAMRLTSHLNFPAKAALPFKGSTPPRLRARQGRNSNPSKLPNGAVSLSKNIFYNAAAFKERRSLFSFKPTKMFVGIDPELVQRLSDYASFCEIPAFAAAYMPIPGRSILLEVPGVPHRIKAKGACGVSEHPENIFELTTPLPQEKRVIYSEWHV